MHIYESYYPPIYNFIRLRVEDRAAAEDMASEVFVKLVKALRSASAPRTSLRGWLFQVARNLLRDHYGRVKQYTVEVLEEWVPNSDDPDPELRFMRARSASSARARHCACCRSTNMRCCCCVSDSLLAGRAETVIFGGVVEAQVEMTWLIAGLSPTVMPNVPGAMDAQAGDLVEVQAFTTRERQLIALDIRLLEDLAQQPPTATPSAVPTRSATATPVLSATPTASPATSPSPTPSATTTASPSPTSTASVTPSPTVRPFTAASPPANPGGSGGNENANANGNDNENDNGSDDNGGNSGSGSGGNDNDGDDD